MKNNQIVKYETKGGNITLDKETVKKYLVNGDGNPTDQEIMMFMQLCKAQNLNPFVREAYLIKYNRSKPANIVVGKDVFTKRAAANPKFKGYEAGIIIETSGKIEKREGTFYLKNSENLVGGYADIYIDGWEMPLKHTVELSEFHTGMSTWEKMPGTMIRKVALVQALREAFPADFQGLYSPEEMPIDMDKLETDEVYVDENDTITAAESRYLMELVEDKSILNSALISKGYTNTNQIKRDEYEEIISFIENANKEYQNQSEDIPEVDVEEVEDIDYPLGNDEDMKAAYEDLEKTYDELEDNEQQMGID